MTAKVITHIADSEAKCPNCNHRVVSRYRLDTEPADAAVCGDCFSEWLAHTNATIS